MYVKQDKTKSSAEIGFDISIRALQKSSKYNLPSKNRAISAEKSSGKSNKNARNEVNNKRFSQISQ